MVLIANHEEEMALIANLEELRDIPQISKDVVSNKELKDNSTKVIDELSYSEIIHNEDKKKSQEYESFDFIFDDFPLGFESNWSDEKWKLEAQESLTK